jgi:hypothetical protein
VHDAVDFSGVGLATVVYLCPSVLEDHQAKFPFTFADEKKYEVLSNGVYEVATGGLPKDCAQPLEQES